MEFGPGSWSGFLHPLIPARAPQPLNFKPTQKLPERQPRGKDRSSISQRFRDYEDGCLTGTYEPGAMACSGFARPLSTVAFFPVATRPIRQSSKANKLVIATAIILQSSVGARSQFAAVSACAS